MVAFFRTLNAKGISRVNTAYWKQKKTTKATQKQHSKLIVWQAKNKLSAVAYVKKLAPASKTGKAQYKKFCGLQREMKNTKSLLFSRSKTSF